MARLFTRINIISFEGSIDPSNSLLNVEVYMKVLTKTLMIILLLATMSGCNNKEIEHLSYEVYKNEFFECISDFNPKEYTDITKDTYTIVAASYPNNNLGKEKIDALNDNIQFPYRYETYYLSDDETILVYINFIYYPQSKKNQFLTIYSIGNKINSNIDKEYQTIQRPLINEYIIAINGYLVEIDFIDVSQDKNEESEYISHFSLQCADFYNQFENTLLAIVENRE